MALEQHGHEEVHKHVGREPSGEEFNALKLNKAMRPHNPLINSGAIMTCSMVGPKGMDAADRFDYVTKYWARRAWCGTFSGVSVLIWPPVWREFNELETERAKSLREIAVDGVPQAANFAFLVEGENVLGPI
jgi:hypothetical protein